MRDIPLTNADRKAMLDVIGAKSIDDLFSSLPKEVVTTKEPAIPAGKTESELRTYFSGLAAKNSATVSNGWLSFLGAGAYDHFIPSVVDALSFRGEFATSYTPYQPEVSQGTLQAIFEFQSMVANLFDLEVANASMYDGASSLAEGVLMAMRIKKGNTVYLSKGIHPDYRDVVRSYLKDAGVLFQDVELDETGRTRVGSLSKEAIALVVQQPNFFGVVENIEPLAEYAHDVDALLTVTTTEAMAFGYLRGPGSDGADIVAGEGQSFGNALSYGGPYVGVFATKKEYTRQMPGRLVGKTVDQENKEGYVLTLATREQHIRRERATSNICTNHSLCALRAAIHMSLLGERGIREVALRNTWAAHQLFSKMKEIKGVQAKYSGPFFNEFTVELPITCDAFLEGMEREQILGGVPLTRWDKNRERDILISVTETKTQKDLDRFVEAARKAL